MPLRSAGISGLSTNIKGTPSLTFVLSEIRPHNHREVCGRLGLLNKSALDTWASISIDLAQLVPDHAFGKRTTCLLLAVPLQTLSTWMLGINCGQEAGVIRRPSEFPKTCSIAQTVMSRCVSGATLMTDGACEFPQPPPPLCIAAPAVENVMIMQ
eukprot:356188-Chlamydomonas_euryale.AAC.16